jgi:hypothetical protein
VTVTYSSYKTREKNTSSERTIQLFEKRAKLLIERILLIVCTSDSLFKGTIREIVSSSQM